MENKNALMFCLPNADGGLRQSEILTDVIERRINIDSARKERETIVDKRIHPYSIILTQDCDLDWDFKNRFSENETLQHKLIPSILLCEVSEANTLRVRSDINATLWKRISQNKDERYHFISNIPLENDLIGRYPELRIMTHCSHS